MNQIYSQLIAYKTTYDSLICKWFYQPSKFCVLKINFAPDHVNVLVDVRYIKQKNVRVR